MLTTREYLIIPLSLFGPCLCIKYFGIVDVQMTNNEFGLVIWVL